MSVSTAVSNTSLADPGPRLPGGMAAEVTTYASIASLGSCAEFIPSRATRQSNNPILREANIDGRNIVQQKGLYCRPTRPSGQQKHPHHHGSVTANGASPVSVRNHLRADRVRNEATGEYIALDFKERAAHGPRSSSRHQLQQHDFPSSQQVAPQQWGGNGGQEARGLQPSAEYANLVQLNDSRQAHAWFGGSAHAAEKAMLGNRQSVHNHHHHHPNHHQLGCPDGIRKLSNSSQCSCGSCNGTAEQRAMGQCSCCLPNNGISSEWISGSPVAQQMLDGSQESSGSSIYVNSGGATRHSSTANMYPASETHPRPDHDEPLYINSAQTPSSDNTATSHNSSLSASTVSSPAMSPLSSPRLSNASDSSGKSGNSQVKPQPQAIPYPIPEATYENTKGRMSTPCFDVAPITPASVAFSHVRSPSEPCHVPVAMFPYEPGQGVANGLQIFPGTEPIYMNESAQAIPRLTKRSWSASALQIDSHVLDIHGCRLDAIPACCSQSQAIPPVTTSSPSPPSVSPIITPSTEELNLNRLSFQTSNADALFGTFQMTFIGAEPVDRGYGVIPQAIRTAIQKCANAVTNPQRVTMKVLATSVTVVRDDGTQKFRHEVDSIESISPWQDTTSPLPADLAVYAAYIVVQEGHSAVCYVFQAADAATRRTVCKTIESALYADVRNFKSMTYPKYEVHTKIKSASQFSVKYVGSILVQTTFRVIDEAARRLLSNTNPAKINFAFMDVGEDRIRLTGTTNSVIFAAHPTSSIACLNVFSEDSRVFGYVVKQKACGTKCHVFRVSRPSLAFAIVDIMKDVIQDNYKANDTDEAASKTDTAQKSNGIRGFLARRREKKSTNGTTGGGSGFQAASSQKGGISSAEQQQSLGQLSDRGRSVSDINLPHFGRVEGMAETTSQYRVDYLGALSIQQSALGDAESRQVVEKMNSVRKHSYQVTMSISERGVFLFDDHQKKSEITVKSIVSVRLHPENAHYALIIVRPPNSPATCFCHVVHQTSRNATDILRDVTKLLV